MIKTYTEGKLFGISLGKPSPIEWQGMTGLATRTLHVSGNRKIIVREGSEGTTELEEKELVNGAYISRGHRKLVAGDVVEYPLFEVNMLGKKREFGKAIVSRRVERDSGE